MNADKMICYCFGYTENDIIDDLAGNNGTSSILDTITEAKSNNQCQCEIKHPDKR
jgi:hypothetical protein